METPNGPLLLKAQSFHHITQIHKQGYTSLNTIGRASMKIIQSNLQHGKLEHGQPAQTNIRRQ